MRGFVTQPAAMQVYHADRDEQHRKCGLREFSYLHEPWSENVSTSEVGVTNGRKETPLTKTLADAEIPFHFP